MSELESVIECPPFDPKNVATFDQLSEIHPTICVHKDDYDRLLDLYLYKSVPISVAEALIEECKPLKSELSKANATEETLLATGESLAEGK